MHAAIKEVLISEAEIQQRTKQLGAEISADYAGKSPLLVALLKGAIPFLAELLKYLTIDCEIDFMDVSSYEGTESVGKVRIDKDLTTAVKGLDIILVEDIIDTGRTMTTVCELLKERGAKSVKVVSLLDKPSRRVMPIKIDYLGFAIENKFVVGFGLDYNQKYRNLPYIGILKEEMY